jgi:cyclohexyl-isocyanide hydratase
LPALFGVLARIPNSTNRLNGKTDGMICDLKGLRLKPDAALIDVPPLDVLHVPAALDRRR